MATEAIPQNRAQGSVAQEIMQPLRLSHHPSIDAQRNHFITDYPAKIHDDDRTEGGRGVQRVIHIIGPPPRLYQQTILATCAAKNALVVLPTGMGKTMVALMLSALRLAQHPSSKILFVAPTRPLVDQHKDTFERSLISSPEDLSVFTGHVRPAKRADLWEKSRIIFSTPQGIENDIMSKRISLEDVSLVVFDEAHRAVGDYSYVFLAKQYVKLAKFPRILALTASPGSDMETIMEVCTNLSIDDIEVRTEEDPDVAPYVQDVKIDWIPVPFDEPFVSVRDLLRDCFAKKIKEMALLGAVTVRNPRMLSRTELLRLQAHLHGEISHGSHDFETLKSVSLAAEALKVQHALELAETQSIASLHAYLGRLCAGATTTIVKALQNLVVDPLFQQACTKVNAIREAKLEHPKMGKVRELVLARSLGPGEKTIIFAQYRDTASAIVETLSTMPGASPRLFVGQAKKGGIGMSQKQQKAMLDEFRSGAFNILVATSVAEEGLDIPKVDTVIFFEPIPSAIRHIQRRGRTGRLEKGSVAVLVTKGTRDEAYRWSAHHKEKQMNRVLREIKRKFRLIMDTRKEKGSADGAQMPSAPAPPSFTPASRPLPSSQTQLPHASAQQHQESPVPEKTEGMSGPATIFADDRERSPVILRALSDKGFAVVTKRLDAGDYMLSERVAVEFKTVPDFVSSIIDGRLLEQARALRRTYQRPIIIVQGDEDIYSQRAVHPNAIRGMLATLCVGYGIPIITSRNDIETAELLSIIAKREHDANPRGFHPHALKPSSTVSELQEYVVSSLPGIGPQLAAPLLEKFGSVRNIFNATHEELCSVDKIGEVKAERIHAVVDAPYRRPKIPMAHSKV